MNYADTITNAVTNIHRNGWDHTEATYLPAKIEQCPDLATDTFSVASHSPFHSGVAVRVEVGIIETLRAMLDTIDRQLKNESTVEGSVTVGDIRVWADDDDHSKGFIGTDGYPEVTYSATIGTWGDCEITIEHA